MAFSTDLLTGHRVEGRREGGEERKREIDGRQKAVKGTKAATTVKSDGN